MHEFINKMCALESVEGAFFLYNEFLFKHLYVICDFSSGFLIANKTVYKFEIKWSMV